MKVEVTINVEPFIATAHGSVAGGIFGAVARLLLGSGAGLAYSLLTYGFKVRPAHLLLYPAAYAVMSGFLYKVNQIIEARNEASTRVKASDPSFRSRGGKPQVRKAVIWLQPFLFYMVVVTLNFFLLLNRVFGAP